MGPLTHADTLTQTGIPHLSPSVKSANTQTMKKPQALTWENSLNPSRCCSSFSATQVDSLTPVQEAVVAVFSSPNAELPGCYSVPWLLCPLGLCVCVPKCVCMNGPEASPGVAACPTADVCWMDKSTYNPLGLEAGSSHGPFLLLSSFCPFFLCLFFYFGAS